MKIQTSLSKSTTKRVKKPTAVWEKTFEMYVTNKVFISGIYELLVTYI